MFQGSVDDADRTCAVIKQSAGGKFAHFSGAEKQNSFPLERAENLASEFDGGVRNRDRGIADGGFIAHALRNSKRLLHHGVKETSGRAEFLRLLPRGFHLRDDLRLADHHGVQAGGNAENMHQRGFVEQAVEMLPLAEHHAEFDAEQAHDGVAASVMSLTHSRNSVRLQVARTMTSSMPSARAN